MRLLSKPAAMAAGLVAALAAVTLAQNPPAVGRAPGSSSEPLLISGIIEWIEKSDVSALTEGVIEQIELREGMEVARGGTIGNLHAEKARLTVAKAEAAVENKGAMMKAQAQRQLAMAELARLRRIQERNPNFVSQSELAKAEAEVNVGAAAEQEAAENRKLAEADRNLARQALKEHTIEAPFDGIILKLLKHPGETVRANEAVVRLGKVDRLRFYGFIPIEHLGRVRPGMVVDIKPTVEEAELPIEQKRFRGKVVAIGTEVQSIGKNEVEVYAEIINNQGKELRPGLRGEMAIYLDSSPVPPPPADMLPQPAHVAKSNP